jgi:hypothetical protein
MITDMERNRMSGSDDDRWFGVLLVVVGCAVLLAAVFWALFT